MPFTKEQANQIKQQLLAQVENLPNENKEQIKKHISQLNEIQLEEFLKQNNIQFQGGELAQAETSGGEEKGTKCIFCSIIHNEIPSYKIAENKKAIAILELNPLSKGHSIILPLEHVQTNQLPKSVLGLAQKIAKKISSKLKPLDIKIETSNFMGHAMVNIIPIYKDISLEKKKAEDSELQELYKTLVTKKRNSAPRAKKTITKSQNTLPKISFRIP